MGMVQLISLLIDARDARLSARLRDEYGVRQWLICWVRQGRSRWVARLSFPEFPESITRIDRSRCHAARPTDEALRLLICEDEPPEAGIDPDQCPHRT
jgi:hypothetical protein